MTSAVRFDGRIDGFDRHLATNQRALLGLKLKPLHDAEAKARQIAAGENYGENHPREVGAMRPQPPLPGRSNEIVANLVGVSSSTIKRITRVERERPDLLEKIESEEITGGPRPPRRLC